MKKIKGRFCASSRTKRLRERKNPKKKEKKTLAPALFFKGEKLVAYYDEQKIRRDVDFTDFASESDAEDWYWETEQDYVSGVLGVSADVAAAFIAAARERFHLVFCVGVAAAQELEAELSDRRRGIR